VLGLFAELSWGWGGRLLLSEGIGVVCELGVLTTDIYLQRIRKESLSS
jgi:hypothetical protein